MLVWRICSQEDPEPFSGRGPQRNGQRWNPPGAAVVYTAENLSLAALEFFVNLNGDGPDNPLCAISAEVPESIAVERVDASSLPGNWRACPAPEALQQIGANWLEAARTAVLAVPSAVIPEERVYLLNPAHPEFRHIRVQPPIAFRFDPRMWKK